VLPLLVSGQLEDLSDLLETFLPGDGSEHGITSRNK
jgi:hypothetical protein